MALQTAHHPPADEHTAGGVHAEELPMNRAEAAGQKLMAAVMEGKSSEPIEDIARAAMAQALVTQAAFQALLRCLAHKNLVGDEELVRFLANAYEASYERLTQPGLIVPGAMNGAQK